MISTRFQGLGLELVNHLIMISKPFLYACELGNIKACRMKLKGIRTYFNGGYLEIALNSCKQTLQFFIFC